MIKYNPKIIDAWVRYAFPDCRGWAVDENGRIYGFINKATPTRHTWVGAFVKYVATIDLGDTDWKDTWHDITEAA